ncbi:CIA30 family protein [Candidatus Chloroploca sp. Khr17]|uniref:CIA30 family protein n=1 Tax=Candidatus Chloroploca sp. Khr17 TaxID=2496869 RepID=UPI00101D2AC1|nr:CIA30 family protein [Candidatus Chloroploca sp. Khr17]
MKSTPHLLSDLQDPAAPGQWRGFSDRVMGGLSREEVTIDTIEGQRCLRLRGEVRLENQGGFVQMALPLDATGHPLDAQAYTGIRLSVWGNGETYRVHLRTTACRRPQQFYWAEFRALAQWHLVELPFTAFTPKWLETPLNPGALTRLGIVAYGRQFHADIAIARVALW